MVYLLLALLSGAPALIYELVWSREVSLAAGARVEAVAIVLAAYFAGLAAGARWLGPRADASPAPLGLYARLEIGAAAWAVVSGLLVRALAEGPLPAWSPLARLALLGVVLLPTTVLLGGTLPALLRAAESRAARAPRTAGWLLGANTVGAAAGVVLACLGIPWLGLQATLRLAAGSAIAIGLVAAALSRTRRVAPRPGRAAARAGRLAAGGAIELREATRTAEGRDPGASARIALLPVALAFVAGIATLGFEVTLTRMTALQLGSSLFAFATVLVLFLAGLGLGNAALAPRAAASRSPLRDLAWLELAAALAMVLAAGALRPTLAASAPGNAAVGSLPLLLLGSFLPAFFMGGAFPFFVRAAVADAADLAAALGRVSAWNTLGGVLGSLLAPFVFLPAFGIPGAALGFAAVNTGLGVALQVPLRRDRLSVFSTAAGLAALLGAAFLALRPPALPPEVHVLFVEHGRQASAVVSRTERHRDLLVDGDPEASTAPGARTTEELLAVLPLLQHPAPRALLEVGFGSGISLGAAARFPLQRIECVEIAASVLHAGRLFVPENRGVLSPGDSRVRIVHDDGRIHLLRRPGRFDVVLANTVHPWSVGATGLYSVEYFTRIARSLRPGGIAAQWLPLQRIGAEDLATLLRTFYAVFAEGAAYWGSNDLILLGSQQPLSQPAPEAVRARLRAAGFETARWEMSDASGLARRRLARAAAVREVVGSGPLLSDDRPTLESSSLFAGEGRAAAVLEVVVGLARAGNADPALQAWVGAGAARARGAEARAAVLEREAEAGGLGLARAARVRAQLALAERARLAGDGAVAEGRLVTLLRETERPEARFALARLRHARGDVAGAAADLERAVDADPGNAPAWNLLGVVRAGRGELGPARRALEHALEADPFLPEALANLGLLAQRQGDRATAQRMAEALRALSPLGPSRVLRALESALAADQRGVRYSR